MTDLEERFNYHFKQSTLKGVVSNGLGRQLLDVSMMVVRRSKIGGMDINTLDIVRSDITMQLVESFNLLIKNNTYSMLKSPYGYFISIARNVLSKIIMNRFSSKRTNDVLGAKKYYVSRYNGVNFKHLIKIESIEKFNEVL